jgi:hypothetical protein
MSQLIVLSDNMFAFAGYTLLLLDEIKAAESRYNRTLRKPLRLSIFPPNATYRHAVYPPLVPPILTSVHSAVIKLS